MAARLPRYTEKLDCAGESVDCNTRVRCDKCVTFVLQLQNLLVIVNFNNDLKTFEDINEKHHTFHLTGMEGDKLKNHK